MLTKKIKFDDDVIEVLKSANWSSDGLSVKIVQQLDRQLYVKVNKALEAAGGKWNKSAKAHVFSTDPRQTIEGIVENGYAEVEKDGFFETPEAVIMRMFELLPPAANDFTLEPSAGLGAISSKLMDAKATVISIEKNIERFRAMLDKGIPTVNLDFMEYHGGPYDKIYMNPPFEMGQDIQHVMHAYDLLAEGGALVAIMSEGPFFREDNAAKKFRLWLENLDGYNEKLPPSSFRESGTEVNARVVLIQKT